MIYCILPNGSTAEILLNNLSEADFDLSQASVIMKDLKQRNAIAPDGGPLKGTNPENVTEKLIELGFSPGDARLYQDKVSQGKVLFAMTVEPESQPAAIEMFQDHSAELIKE